ncbi:MULTISPECIES: helix-turn-helix transcriptional regulator [Pasteurellaceae]|uniref:AlpA family phage regulatory protein n=1 Tax=Pasteurella atlantica TaxID=2827233 RepID=A0AAW8CMD5_9PAST|nr:AlpA family phage regulatory protein [Pasteurella atlantica]MBR0573387.1 AlpA family phage regulatory protein [Pasteurella atlantica]MDP8039805.1 AlpA family phage regulatory protein [Pasteurella atlantica]MDP8041822.1 AlpA family phage regulatory protein [Pasteurella atlantica]MDP8043889.1 AlpA family phage regulatory protein [Pasteurella atlantica]MDP8046108.1 AlpA family phage regulatory protein [Pasteurella atlantica]
MKKSTQINQLLTLSEVVELVGIGVTSIYKYMKQGKFPQPKRIGKRAVRWRLSDIEEYINS